MPKKKIGRPSLYTDKLAAEICIRLAIGESLVQICKEDAMPAYRTVMNWLFEERAEGDPKRGFLHKYARAREVQAMTYVDQMVVLADDDSRDVLYDLDGQPVQATSVRINRHRLQIDTRWRIITKLLPRFADRIVPESVDEAIPIEAEVLEPRELARQVALILYRGDPKRLTHQSKE